MKKFFTGAELVVECLIQEKVKGAKGRRHSALKVVVAELQDLQPGEIANLRRERAGEPIVAQHHTDLVCAGLLRWGWKWVWKLDAKG